LEGVSPGSRTGSVRNLSGGECLPVGETFDASDVVPDGTFALPLPSSGTHPLLVNPPGHVFRKFFSNFDLWQDRLSEPGALIEVVRETGRGFAEDCEPAPRLARYPPAAEHVDWREERRSREDSACHGRAEARGEEAVAAGGLVGDGPHFFNPNLLSRG